jgi:hypothetical protein
VGSGANSRLLLSWAAMPAVMGVQTSPNGWTPCRNLTRGGLARIWKNLRKGLRHRAIPGWFQPWTHFEAQAVTLRSYEPLLVPGLLQTEDYARAILSDRPGGKHDDLEDQVAARMDRQAILTRADPPQL